MSGQPRISLLLLLVPLLVAASDQQGDVAPCRGSGDASGPIDIVEARGEIIERGKALRFTVVFDEPIPVPDEEGRPLRVDIVLRDPSVPTMSFGYYRDINRIVRFDAVPDPLLQIVLLPEQGANVFVGAVALGDTLTMSLPGRLITHDADLGGLALESIGWNVIARDERACDTIGEGLPELRLEMVRDEESSATASPAPVSDGSLGGSDVRGAVGWVLAACGVLTVGLTAWLVRRRTEQAR